MLQNRNGQILFLFFFFLRNILLFYNFTNTQTKLKLSDHLISSFICIKSIPKLILCFNSAGTTNPRWSELWFVETQRTDFQLYNQAAGNYFTKNVPRQQLPAGTRRRAAASMTPLFSFFPIFAQTFRRYSTNFL